ncbi:MAG: hypothetical protein SFW07_07620 [Gammaproteobacteria bacterium]|nr:hypothetical protein [Gammaproteobacteria bacterium]
MEQLKEVQEELAEKKSVYDYDKICDFFEAYEETKRAGEKGSPYIDTDSKYVIRYSFSSKDFIQFILKEELPERIEGKNEEIDIFNIHELKLHICLPEEDPKIYRQGWQIVVDILTLYDAANFKFIKRGKLMSSKQGQEGKDITVYVDADNRNVEDVEDKRGWKFIISEINKALILANIPPGKRPPYTEEKQEKYITNCEYISYRYEKGIPPRDPLASIALKSKEEIMWEHNVVNLQTIDNNVNDRQNVSKCCCK